MPKNVQKKRGGKRMHAMGAQMPPAQSKRSAEKMPNKPREEQIISAIKNMTDIYHSLGLHEDWLQHYKGLLEEPAPRENEAEYMQAVELHERWFNMFHLSEQEVSLIQAFLKVSNSKELARIVEPWSKAVARKTGREIPKREKLTDRTMNFHLYRVLNRTGMKSRSDLAYEYFNFFMDRLRHAK